MFQKESTLPRTTKPPQAEALVSLSLSNAERVIERFRANVAANIPTESDRRRIEDALTFTEQLCKGYRPRGDGRERIIHPVEVADDLITKFKVCDPDMIIAGLLHDAVEDQAEKVIELCGNLNVDGGIRKRALASIANRYNGRVSAFVGYLTNPDIVIESEVLARSGKKKDAILSKSIIHDHYHTHLIEIAATHRFGFVIKVADFARNAFNLYLVGQNTKHKDPIALQETLAEKYFPSMLFLEDYLKNIRDTSNPLYPHRQWLLNELGNAAERDYSKLIAKHHVSFGGAL